MSSPKVLIALSVFGILAAASFPKFLPKSIDFNPPRAHPEKRMKAMVYHESGSPSVMKLDPNYSQPVLEPGHLLIKVYASSINPCDFKNRRNPIPSFLQPKPKIPGEDIAGVLMAGARGEDDSKFHLGNHVVAMLPILGHSWGAAAEYVSVKREYVARMTGNSISFDDAASLPLVSLTAIQALEKIKFQDGTTKGKKILVHAGAGGLGTFTIQYAKHVLGMYVACTASREKEGLLRDLGADLVIDYRSENFEDIVQDYDVVFDSMSWAYESRSLGSGVLKRSGHYLNIMSSDWEWDGKEQGNGFLSFLRWFLYGAVNSIISGILPNYYICVVEPNGDQLQKVMDLVDAGTIRAVIDKRFPLDEIADAHEYLELGHATGKVVLHHAKEDTSSVRFVDPKTLMQE